jgi:hypothetical protein
MFRGFFPKFRNASDSRAGLGRTWLDAGDWHVEEFKIVDQCETWSLECRKPLSREEI